jgi:hypothetical protein
LLVLAAICGGWLLYRTVSDPFRTLTPLDAGAYLENANSLRGNVYKVTGTVESQLAWSPQTGRLYAVGLNGGNDVVALLVPAAFNSRNMQVGQRYFFEIEIGEKGVLHVRDLRKV